MKSRYILILLTALIVYSCGTSRRVSVTYPAHDTDPDGFPRRVLYPVGSDPDGYIEPRDHETTTVVYIERPVMDFSETEAAHVRSAGIRNSFPDEGITLDLDELRCEFCYPYRGKFISDYGMRGRSFHAGVDIKAIPDDTVRAAFPGVVRMSKLYSSYGNIVVIRHYTGIETVYSHGSRNLVQVNDVVRAGDPVALAGRTGRATTEHLHFEVRAGGEHFDPKLMIDCEKMDLRTGKIFIRRINGEIIASTSQEGVILEGSRIAERNALRQAAEREAEAASSAATDSAPRQTPAADAQYHTIVSGDTLYALSRRYGTTVKKICELNGISETAILRLGQKVRVK